MPEPTSKPINPDRIQKKPVVRISTQAEGLLVIDDSAVIAFMLLMILQHAGYEAVMSIIFGKARAF
jgi:hypothetical protein